MGATGGTISSQPYFPSGACSDLERVSIALSLYFGESNAMPPSLAKPMFKG